MTDYISRAELDAAFCKASAPAFDNHGKATFIVDYKQGTIWIEYGGERMQLSYWADRLGLPYHTLYDRLHRYGWPVERALTEPVRRAL